MNPQDMEELRDIKPPEELPFDWHAFAPYAAMILVALLLFALAWWWNKRRKQGPTPPNIPALPPDHIALNELRAHLKTYEEGHISKRQYGFAVSETLRIFMESRWAINATDLTTHELKKALHAYELPPAEINDIIDLLTRADSIKFSDQESNAEVHSMHQHAANFVTRNKPVPVPQSGGTTP